MKSTQTIETKKDLMSVENSTNTRSLVRPRRESNPHFKNRNLTCYPLHHEGKIKSADATYTNNTLSYYMSTSLCLQGEFFHKSLSILGGDWLRWRSEIHAKKVEEILREIQSNCLTFFDYQCIITYIT